MTRIARFYAGLFLLFVTIATKPFAAFVGRHFHALPLFPRGHSALSSCQVIVIVADGNSLPCQISLSCEQAREKPVLANTGHGCATKKECALFDFFRQDARGETEQIYQERQTFNFEGELWQAIIVMDWIGMDAGCALLKMRLAQKKCPQWPNRGLEHETVLVAFCFG